MKNIITIIVVLMLLLSSCAKNEPDMVLDNSYITSNVRVTEVEPLEENKITEVNWVNPAYTVLKDKVDMVVKGKITGVKEIELRYETPDKEYTEYGSVIDFKITKSLVSDVVDSPKTIKVYIGISSRSFPDGFEDDVITEGKEYYLLLENLENLEDDMFNIKALADYCLVYPRDFLIPVDVTQDKLTRVVEIFSSERNKTTYVETIENYGLFSAEELETFFENYFK